MAEILGVVARGAGKRRNEDWLLTDTGFLFSDKNVLEVDTGKDCVICKHPYKALNCTLENGEDFLL